MINAVSIMELIESFLNEEKKIVDLLSKKEIPIKDAKQFVISNKCETNNWCSVAQMKKWLKDDSTTKFIKIDAIKSDDSAFVLYDDGSGAKWYPCKVS